MARARYPWGRPLTREWLTADGTRVRDYWNGFGVVLRRVEMVAYVERALVSVSLSPTERR